MIYSINKGTNYSLYKCNVCKRFCTFYIGFWLSYSSLCSEVDCSFHVCNLIIFVHHMGRVGFTGCGALDYCHFPIFTKSWLFCFCFWRKSSLFFCEKSVPLKIVFFLRCRASKRGVPGNLQKCHSYSKSGSDNGVHHEDDDEPHMLRWWLKGVFCTHTNRNKLVQYFFSMIYFPSNLLRSINTKRKQKKSQIPPPLLLPLTVSFVKLS